MGYSQAELKQVAQQIKDVAELGEHFNQPMRAYSREMQACLACSLVTARRPEILIVDEILSVGDSYFHHKSFGRIPEFNEKGTSILLVAHGLTDRRALCDRVILPDNGAIVKDGLPRDFVDYNKAVIAVRDNEKLTVEQRRDKRGWLHPLSGSFEISASSVDLLDAGQRTLVATAREGQTLFLRIAVGATEDIARLVTGAMLRDRNGGHIVWGANTWHTGQKLDDAHKGDALTIDIGPNPYDFAVALSASDTNLEKNYEWQDNVGVFDVVNEDFPYFRSKTELGTQFGS